MLDGEQMLEESVKFNFGLIQLGMPERHPGEDVKELVVHETENKNKMRSADIIWELLSWRRLLNQG